MPPSTDSYVNHSTWLTHAMIDQAIARKVSVQDTFDMRAECYRVRANSLGDLLSRVLDDRDAKENSPDPLAQLSLDELLDLRSALTESIDRHGKFPEDDEMIERVNRWQALAERIDEHSDMESGS